MRAGRLDLLSWAVDLVGPRLLLPLTRLALNVLPLPGPLGFTLALEPCGGEAGLRGRGDFPVRLGGRL